MPYSKHLPKILTITEIELIEKTARKSEFYPPTEMAKFLKERDICTWKLMFFTGLRPAECFQLKWKDLDFENRKIFVRPYINKRKNDLPAIMTLPAKELLLEYKKIVENFSIQTEWLFPSVWSWQPITESTMYRRFAKILNESGLMGLERRNLAGKPIYTYNLYSLRHSYGTLCWKKTKSDIATSRLMRHTKVESANSTLSS